MRLLRLLAAGLALAVAAGCGGRSTASVSGVVTLDGKPLEGAAVSFTPASRDGGGVGGSYGKTDANGRYTLRTVVTNATGAAVGKHRVSISLYKEDPKNPDGAGRKELVPAKYNAKSELTFEIPSGG